MNTLTTALISAPSVPKSQEDQAAGLRRQFRNRWVPTVAVLSNPYNRWSGLMLDLLTQAMGRLGRRALLVDASQTAGAPSAWAAVDLPWAVDHRHPQYSYLAARGLVQACRSRGDSPLSLLSQWADAAPQTHALVVHAAAPELLSLYGGMPASVLLLAENQEASLAYAAQAVHRLAHRNPGSFDLLLHTLGDPQLAYRRASRLEATVRTMSACPLRQVIAVHGEIRQDEAALRAMTELLQQQLDPSAIDMAYRAIHRTVHLVH